MILAVLLDIFFLCGGNPGFIQISDRRTLRILDYIGNGMFNTLGNLAVNPRAGLVFIDFDRSRTLQLIGRANILWDLEESEYPTGGTRRYWDFKVEKWLYQLEKVMRDEGSVASSLIYWVKRIDSSPLPPPTARLALGEETESSTCFATAKLPCSIWGNKKNQPSFLVWTRYYNTLSISLTTLGKWY